MLRYAGAVATGALAATQDNACNSTSCNAACPKSGPETALSSVLLKIPKYGLGLFLMELQGFAQAGQEVEWQGQFF